MRSESAEAAEALEHGLACFYLREGLFCINIRLVREINQHLDITPARRSPPFVTGLVNLRGQIVTVIDLGNRLGMGKSDLSHSSRLVILKTNSELNALSNCQLETCEDKVGLLVDQISDVVQPEANMLEGPPPNLEKAGSEYLAGVCKTDTTTIGILDLRRLLHYSSAATDA